ncbi:MAG TPA: DUF2306 domain-containing protein [Thermoanaerobaculia bacterium]
MSPILLIHICSAIVGLLSGYMAMAFRKGSRWHGAAGTVFFVSMISMTLSAAWVAEFLRPNKLNLVVAMLTFYLVSTAWWAAKRRDPKPGRFDLGALLFIFVVGAAGLAYGFEAANSATGTKDRMPAAIYFVFGTIAMLCATSDVRMLIRGSLAGGHRIARHLWRMCLALLIATMSFYPGQAKLFSAAVRSTNLLYVPHVILIGAMLFWLVRVSTRRRARVKEVARREPPIGVAVRA